MNDRLENIDRLAAFLMAVAGILATGFTLFALAFLAKLIVDTWTGGCAI